MPAAMVDNRIAGSRITVFDVYYYLDLGRSPAEVEDILRISPEEFAAAQRYIEENRALGFPGLEARGPVRSLC